MKAVKAVKNAMKMVQAAGSSTGIDAVKAKVQKNLAGKWKDDKWTSFIAEVATFLLSKGKDADDVADTVTVLIKAGYITEEDLAGISSDKREFRLELDNKGVQSAISNLLFDEFVGGLEVKVKKALGTAPLDTRAMMNLKHVLPKNSPLAECTHQLPSRDLKAYKRDPPRRDLKAYKRDPREDSSADFLMHGLGVDEFMDNEAVRKFIVDRVDVQPCALYGTSGAGKTRSIFEFLSKEFGFFFLSTISDTNAGAGDFPQVIEGLKGISKKTRNSKKEYDTKALDGMMEHQEIYTDKLMVLVISRLMIFHVTRDLFEEKYAKEKYVFGPLDWLYCQLFPSLLYGKDVFTSVLRIVEGVIASGNLDRGGLLDDTRTLVDQPMYCFVDEAQILVNKFTTGYFISADKNTDRSLYSATVKGFNTITKETGAHWNPVMSGTGLSITAIKNEGTSVVAKTGGKETYIFHEFKHLDVEGVKAYMGRFIDLTRFDPNLVNHVAKWLVGRPRWTAFFMNIWMLREKFRAVPKEGLFYDELEASMGAAGIPKKKQKPVVTLEEYNQEMQLEIQRFIELMTLEGSATSSRASKSFNSTGTAINALIRMERKIVEGGNVLSFHGKFLDALAVYLSTGKDCVLRSDDDDGAVKSDGKSTTLELSRELINVGICSVDIKETKKVDVFNAVINEPIMVEAAFQFFLKNGTLRSSLLQQLSKKNMASSAFENLSLILAYVNLEALIKRSVDYICRGTRSEDGVRVIAKYFTDFNMGKTAYGVLIENCENANETLQHLENAIRSPFPASVPPICNPDQSFGPDGFLLMRKSNDVTQLLPVIFQMKFNHESYEDQRKVNETLIPELMFRTKVKLDVEKGERQTYEKAIAQKYYIERDPDFIRRWIWVASKLFDLNLPNLNATLGIWPDPLEFTDGFTVAAEAVQAASEYKKVSQKLKELRKENEKRRNDHMENTGESATRSELRKWDRKAQQESKKEVVDSPTFNPDVVDKVANLWRSRRRPVVKISVQYTPPRNPPPLANLEHFSTIPPETRSEDDKGEKYDLLIYFDSNQFADMLPSSEKVKLDDIIEGNKARKGKRN